MGGDTEEYETTQSKKSATLGEIGDAIAERVSNKLGKIILCCFFIMLSLDMLHVLLFKHGG